jgi:hypothetical protein
MTEKDLLELARQQYAEALESDTTIREEFKEDLRIFDGEGIWPERLRMAREGDPKGARPCLNISDLGPRVHQVTNDFRQNPPSIKIRPVDDNADVDTAKVFNGLARHMEQQSDADIAYQTSNFYQSVGGFGYFRMTEEMKDGTAELMIKTIANPLSVKMDPFAMDPTGCDARFCFIDEDIPKATFKREYPNVDMEGWGEGDEESGWITEDSVRVAEWFNIEEVSSKNKIQTEAYGELGEDDYWAKAEELGEQPKVKASGIEKRKVCVWRKMVGTKILKTVTLPIYYIPVFRMAGETYITQGRRVFKGMVRDSRDAVRSVSYTFSAFIETVALQPKAPFIGVAGQFDGFERDWAGANTENHAYLEYNSVDINGKDAPPPQRSQPPLASQGLMQALTLAQNALKDTSGLGAASLGQKGNETSGKAILARQREGDVSTFHLQDNAAKAIRQCGRVFVQWAPKVYDEPVVARIIGEDGSADQAYLDPSQEQSVRKISMPDGSIRSIYNLGVGKYDVIASVGPSYTTKRVEQAEMMNQLFQAFPQAFPVLGDIYLEMQDGPGMDRMAKRLKAMLPPQAAAADEEENQVPIPQEVQAKLKQMQDLLQQGQQAVNELMQENQKLQQQVASKEAEVQAKVYGENEETERTKIDAAKSIQIAEMNNNSKEAIAGLQQQMSEMQQAFEQQRLFIETIQAQKQMDHSQGMDMENMRQSQEQSQFDREQAIAQSQQPTQPSGV